MRVRRKEREVKVAQIAPPTPSHLEHVLGKSFLNSNEDEEKETEIEGGAAPAI